MTANNRSQLLAAVVITASVLTAPDASSALTEAASFEEKVANAEAIVLGKCVRTRSEWDPSHRTILTYSTFAIEKSLKGSASGEITIVTPGGRVGDVQQESIGIPVFEPGQERVVFVKNTKVGPTVLYFDQGTYEVRADDRGQRVIAPVSSEAVRVDTQRGVIVPNEPPRPLGDFEFRVKKISKDAVTKMNVVKQPAPEEKPSILAVLIENKWLVAAALAGIALASWQYYRR